MAFRTNKTPVLQEKSASGSVASFNTALAMPLSSCNIAVNAWQEGSGDPSPVNNRPIHGFSEVNATRAGKNLIIISAEAEARKNAGTLFTLTYSSNNTVQFNPTTVGSLYVIWKIVKIPISWVGLTLTLTLTRTGASSGRFICSTTSDFTSWDGMANVNVFTVTITSNYVGKYMGFMMGNSSGANASISNVMLAFSESAYQPYQCNTYTIQLGQEVYGAEVDVVNGVAHVTHKKATYNGTESWTYRQESDSVYHIQSDMNRAYNLQNGKCDIFPIVNNYSTFGCLLGVGNNAIYVNKITNLGVDSVDTFKTWLTTHNMTVVYPLATPFDIQLTPTQIETIAGKTNTIFADTGDIDLTYKDLDIAKRGNFREVFKLPS